MRLRKFWPLVLLLAILPAPAQTAAAPTVVKLVVHDTIQPVSAGYIRNGLQHAATVHASAVLLSLGTPGGLLDSTREIVSAIDSSPVPVIVYVAPTSSRAGSAGFYILEAADIAAMAPGTNAGAAHPVLEGTTMDPVLKQKIENDAVAFFRSYASHRGRDVQAAMDAILQSKSYTDAEALNLKLIDIISPSEAALIASLDGRPITRFDGSHVILHLAAARIDTLMPSLHERVLSHLVNPDLAVLMLIVGGLLIYLEFHVPGTAVPGAIGTVLVLLSFFALNLLPIHHAALLLLLAALGLIIAETKFPSHGALALAGIVSLVFGLLLLVDGPIPEMRVHLSTALSLGIAFGSITSVLAYLAVKAKRNKSVLGPQSMLGCIATALQPLAPSGQVEIRGEIWQAVLATPNACAAPGQQLRVQAVEGLTLQVEPIREARAKAE